MHFTNSIAQVIFCLSVTVLPVAQSSIAIGNQIREGGTHFNVAWVEGVNPCQSDVEIAPESSRECDQNFSLNGEEYYLVFRLIKHKSVFEANILSGWMH